MQAYDLMCCENAWWHALMEATVVSRRNGATALEQQPATVRLISAIIQITDRREPSHAPSQLVGFDT